MSETDVKNKAKSLFARIAEGHRLLSFKQIVPDYGKNTKKCEKNCKDCQWWNQERHAIEYNERLHKMLMSLCEQAVVKGWDEKFVFLAVNSTPFILSCVSPDYVVNNKSNGYLIPCGSKPCEECKLSDKKVRKTAKKGRK